MAAVVGVRSIPDLKRYLQDAERCDGDHMTILVAGIGNLFLSDDGFGPEVVRRLAERGDLPRRACGSSTTASAACTWPTTCSTAYDALVLVDALPGR